MEGGGLMSEVPLYGTWKTVEATLWPVSLWGYNPA